MKEPLIHIAQKKGKTILVLEGETDMQIAELLKKAMKGDQTLFAIIQYAFSLMVLDRLQENYEDKHGSHIV